MRVGRSHHSVRRGRVELSYHCNRCDHRALAQVQSTGIGAGFSAFGVFASIARDQAQDSSEQGQRQDALRTLEQVKCPSCGGRRTGAIAGAFIATLFVCCLLSLPLLAFNWLLFYDRPAGTPVIYVAMCAGILGSYALIRVVRMLRAGSRVEFER